MKKMWAFFGLLGPLIIGVVIVSIVFILITTNDDDSGCSTDINDNTNNVITTDDMNKNAKSIYDYVRKKTGATPQGAAGLLGVWQKESNLSTKAKNPSGAYGLAQWLGSRYDALVTFAEKKGKEKNDLGLQLDFFIHELGDPYYKKAKADLKLNDVHGAAKALLIDYEGMANNPEQWFLPERYSYADHWYSKLGSSDPIAGDGTDTASQGSSDDSSNDCSTSDSNDGSILSIAKGWLGWFYYVQEHPSGDLGKDLKSPNRSGGTDCSGFVWLVLNRAGYKVPKNMAWFTGTMASDAKSSHHWFKEIDKSEAKAGDVVIVNQGVGAGDNGHTAILEENWHGKSTKIIEQGGVGDHVNEGKFGTSFMSLLNGGDVVLARPIK